MLMVEISLNVIRLMKNLLQVHKYFLYMFVVVVLIAFIRLFS